MEFEGAKAVVFGIGGAGCKIVDELAKVAPNNTDLIALDIDQAQLDTLDDEIKKVKLGESLAKKCGSFEEIKHGLSTEIRTLEASLEGVNIAIVIVGLGGNTGTCIGNFIADLCTQKNLFTLFVPIYPLNKESGGPARAEAAIRRLRDNVDGIIVVDNNLKRDGGNVPMLRVFKQVNAMISELIITMICSISNLCTMGLDKEELRHFFYGDLYFLLTSGESLSPEKAFEKALDELKRYAEVSTIEKILVMITTPIEISIEDMKNFNNRLEGEVHPDAIKWINKSGESKVTQILLVSAVTELPLVEGVKMPEEIESKEETVKEVINPYQEIRLNETLETLSENPEKFRSPALIGLEKRADEAEKQALEEAEMGVEEERLKALEEQKVEEEEEVSEEDEIDDIVGELTGFPVFKKKKGQKKLEDYKDNLGIDYI